ncbi:MAG: autotransporter-associated beta strand repeat-containing protein, partial [Luteolibacter sp.]
AIYADFSLGGNNDVLTISKQIDFGAVEGVIGTTGSLNSKTLSFAGGINGSGGITIYTTNTTATTQGGVNLGAANTYTGNTVINGQAIAGNANALPNFANSSRTGDVYVNGTLGLSGSNNNSVRMNGLWGNGRIITPFSNNETLIVGDNNATSTFSGTITQTSGGITLTKIGNGTLTFSGTTSTYTNATSIQNGTISAVTLNNVAVPLTSSSLGRPTTAGTGTINMGNLATAGQLTVVGTGETTDRVINLSGRTGGATLDQSGTGQLIFTSDFTAPGVNAIDERKTLTLQGSTAGTGEIGGAIVDSLLGSVNQKATSVTKDGTGTWTLSGTNTYTGTTSVLGGKLVVSGNLSTGDVNVAATLGGNGNIGGNVNIASTGHHALAVATNPGSQVTRVITGILDLSAGSILDVSAAATPTGGTYILATASSITGTLGTPTYTGLPGGSVVTVVDGNKLQLFVPGGNDYNTWVASISGTFSPTTPTADADGDGLTNQQEYAFGLIPNDGSSVNPITAQLDKASGTFTYTRRKPSLTSLVYAYQYSTTLSGWTAFTPTSTSTNSGNPVEAITVTVPAALLSNPKIFVRVTAQ